MLMIFSFCRYFFDYVSSILKRTVPTKRIKCFLKDYKGFSLFETFLVLLLAGGLLGGIFSLYRSSKETMKKQQLKNFWMLYCQYADSFSAQQYLWDHQEDLEQEEDSFNEGFFANSSSGGKKPRFQSLEVSVVLHEGSPMLALHSLGNRKKGSLTYEEASCLKDQNPRIFLLPGEGQQCQKNQKKSGCLVYSPLGSL